MAHIVADITKSHSTIWILKIERCDSQNSDLGREYKVGEAKFHVFSVQNSKNELFLIVFGKNYDCSIRTAAYKVFQRSNSKPKKEKYVQKVQKHRK